MEDMNQRKDLHIHPPQVIVTLAAVALGMLALFLLILTVSELRGYKYIGAGISPTNTISVSGEGEVFAVPDTGEFSVTIQEEAKEVAKAQDEMAKKANAIMAYLKGAGVEEKDIKTTDYNVSPRYEWTQGICTGGYCPPGKQNLIGFQASETINVKVRDTQKAGELLSGVGGKGAYQVSGLSFTIDDEDALKAEARDKAIEQAKEKADVLAKSLGVSIVRVVGFYENEGGYPTPMYARADMAMGGSMEKAVVPEIAVGQNKIISNVNVTYEIR
ncbi:DUF541 domain-containing protein [Candidatus Kaiserbacteria bacterium]|nr:DUF541 domain-containing protein [Candidatus Kaiserbacteria bacterium]